jgi:hypothetical protein
MDDQSNPLMILSLTAGYGLVLRCNRPAVPDAVAAAVVLAMWTTPAIAPADFLDEAGECTFFILAISVRANEGKLSYSLLLLSPLWPVLSYPLLLRSLSRPVMSYPLCFYCRL